MRNVSEISASLWCPVSNSLYVDECENKNIEVMKNMYKEAYNNVLDLRQAISLMDDEIRVLKEKYNNCILARNSADYDRHKNVMRENTKRKRQQKIIIGTQEYIAEFFKDSNYYIETIKTDEHNIFGVGTILEVYSAKGLNENIFPQNKRRMAIIFFNKNGEKTYSESQYRKLLKIDEREFLGYSITVSAYQLLETIEKEAQYWLQDKFIKCDNKQIVLKNIIARIKKTIKYKE